MTWRHRLSAVVLAAGLAVTGAATAAAAQPEGAVVPAKQHFGDQYIVVLKDQAHAQPFAAASTLAQRYGGEVRSTYSATIHGFSARHLTAQQARRLAADPAVRTVYEDGTATALDTQNNPTWGLDRIDQQNLPLDKKYSYANGGEGATAYVIDSGIKKDNPEFGGRASVGADFINDGHNGEDCFGHGNHVSGTIASKTYGVAKKTKVVMLRALGVNCGNTGPDSAAVDAMDWVTKNGVKPGVVNMSLGMDQVGVGDEALKKSVAAGFNYAVAAGNDNKDGCQVSPGRVPEAITVGATGSGDGRASYSNYGSCLDLFAPGDNVTSLGLQDGSTSNMSGTSMATPHVAGAVVLYLTANPNATPQQVRDALVDNATSGVVGNPGSGSPNKLLYTGFIGGPQPPDGKFAISVDPATAKVAPGETATATVSSTAGNQGAEKVDLTVAGAPEGAKTSFDPASINTGQSAKLAVRTGTGTAKGDYRLTITATAAGGTQKTAVLTLTVADPAPPAGEVKVALSPGSGSARAGNFVSVTVTASGGTGSLTLDASGVQFKPWFNPQSVSSGGSSTMQVLAPFGAGTYKITVTATDSAGKTGSADYTLTVS
ncbi:serine protease [Kutzneria viridogrisea]|uniref:Serine protease, subtilisin family n=1 Tax=Kutzneria viridogrisea TaxID=47990 RepID=A0ABR6BKS9_9PSEU|nr:hypothetical protein [Kutzneria viridogrisea]